MVSSALEVPFEMRMAFVQMAYGISLGLMGILIAPVFWMAAIPFWLSAFLVAYFPEYNDVWTSLSKSLAFCGMTIFWLIKNPTAIRLSFHTKSVHVTTVLGSQSTHPISGDDGGQQSHQSHVDDHARALLGWQDGHPRFQHQSEGLPARG